MAAKPAIKARTIIPPHPASGTHLRSPIRAVLRRPHPLLAMRSIDTDPCSTNVVDLAAVLVATMRSSPACVGLAAPQIGELARVFCMDVTGHPKARSCAGLVVMVNPRIVERRGAIIMREGCMSVPHFTGNIVRAAEVTVEGQAPRTGETFRVWADGMEARCLQHEIDHLDGMLFVDRVTNESTDLFKRKTYA
jgi:peptide deformylase